MGEKLKVLVVDDDQRMVKTICDILTVKGYAAAPAYSGEDALEKANSEEPDCVLMDIKMPGIDGVEAVRLMTEAAPGLPVLLMSAYATREKAEEARLNGAYAVLAKPIDLQLLLSFLSILRKDESILVVDDDPQFCRTLKDGLEKTGYLVETEGEPGKVLGHMEQGYRLAVILDLKLGASDGIEVFREIRARYPEKPVVLITGCGEEMAPTIETGLCSGAYACLRKPFETAELVRVIEEISQGKLRALLGDTSLIRRFQGKSPL
ncbi:MAG: response regulator [Geobacteraceae bacterium]|nr:response regulator [Geobacteraceae bacterium]